MLTREGGGEKTTTTHTPHTHTYHTHTHTHRRTTFNQTIKKPIYFQTQPLNYGNFVSYSCP